MKYFLFISVLLVATSFSIPEEGILIRKELIADLSNTPIYDRLTENTDGKINWKEEFKYLDSIEIYSITYLSDGLKVNGFLVRPKMDGNYPCVIFNRGGNRNFGSLKIAHAAITLGEIAKEGYVVIASQYRGNAGSEGKEEFGGSDVNDIVILPKVLEEVEGADTSRIGMYGWSRGGMMTYIALTKMQNIKAAAVGGALSDCWGNIEERPEMETDVMAELIPNYFENKEAELTKRSAIKWAYKFSKDVPILLLHGNSDWRVKPEQSLKLALEFEKHRIPFRLVMFEGGDHGISEHRDEVSMQVINWFDRYLKKDEPLPNVEYHGE